MTAIGWLQILSFLVVVLALTRPLGKYMFRVFEGEPPFPKIAQWLLKLCGTKGEEQTWGVYAFSLIAFSLFGMLVTYGIQRLQRRAALQPAAPRRRWSRASPSTPPRASPPTPTGRPIRGESTMSYLTQMAGLAWHNFTSAAAGIAVRAGARARPDAAGGRRLRRSATSGST